MYGIINQLDTLETNPIFQDRGLVHKVLSPLKRLNTDVSFYVKKINDIKEFIIIVTKRLDMLKYMVLENKALGLYGTFRAYSALNTNSFLSKLPNALSEQTTEFLESASKMPFIFNEVCEEFSQRHNMLNLQIYSMLTPNSSYVNFFRRKFFITNKYMKGCSANHIVREIGIPNGTADVHIKNVKNKI